MLAVEIEFLTGRYVATDYADRSKAEWPPHPARIYSALVATHHTLGDAPEGRRALQWLEQQGPPRITASAAHSRTVSTHFVPVNDTSVNTHSTVDRKSQAVDDALANLEDATSDKGRAKALKSVEQALAALDAASEKEASGDYKIPTKLENFPKLLPAERVRQARTFPSVAPEDPIVVLQWPDATPPPEVREPLSDLVAAVSRIGHSSSLVRCRLLDEAPSPTLIPDDLGNVPLRCIRDGQLARLEDSYQRHRGVSPRVTPAYVQAYGHVDLEAGRDPVESSLRGEWLVFRLRGDRLPLQAAAALSRLFRAALVDAMTDEREILPEGLVGHDAEGRPSRKPHLAIWPLPFTGHQHADGLIKGIALVPPPDLDADAHRLLLRAIGRLEERYDPNPEPGAEPTLELRFRDGVVVQLERYLDPPRLRSLQPWLWCRPSRHWVTVLPIALSRHPGKLTGTDESRLAPRWDAAKATVRRACTHIGLPEPVDLTLSLAPFVRGSEPIRTFPPFPAARAKGPRRMLVHASLTFDVPVRGPVVLGAGRHFGLGLCRPVLAGGER